MEYMESNSQPSPLHHSVASLFFCIEAVNLQPVGSLQVESWARRQELVVRQQIPQQDETSIGKVSLCLQVTGGKIDEQNIRIFIMYNLLDYVASVAKGGTKTKINQNLHCLPSSLASTAFKSVLQSCSRRLWPCRARGESSRSKKGEETHVQSGNRQTSKFPSRRGSRGGADQCHWIKPEDERKGRERRRDGGMERRAGRRARRSQEGQLGHH